jgi:hypothetical protein
MSVLIKQRGVLMHWYAVALWRAWYPSALAEADVYVLAPRAFAAIETAMQAYQMKSVAYAAADLVGGSLHYRAFGVHVVLDPSIVLEALSLLEMEAPECVAPLVYKPGCTLAGEPDERMYVACYP